MITRFHEEAMKIINHQLRTRFKTLTEELSQDFPQLGKVEIVIMLAKSMSLYSYASLLAIFKDNDIASIVATRQIEQEYRHFKENSSWSQNSQNSSIDARLMESLLKAFKGFKQQSHEAADIPKENGS